MTRGDLIGRVKALAERHLPIAAREYMRALYRRTRSDFYPYHSWSGTGEDLILQHVFGDTATGFYVDIGAAHPKYGSNTYLLYKRGWRGINVDAAPGSMKAFRRVRPRDTNLEVGISDVPGVLPFHVFSDDVLNTFDADLANKRAVKHHLDHVVQVTTQTLAEVLTQHAPHQVIDLLSVDCEGFDERVLRSNDWQRFRPRIVVVESLEGPLPASELPIRAILEDHGYALFANTPFNLFFRACAPPAAPRAPRATSANLP